MTFTIQQMKHFLTHTVCRGFLSLAGLTGLVMVSSAHIGSPDVWIEGNAGPYPVVVNVQVPGVVPGIANVYVRVTGEGIREVLASSNTFDATGGTPPPEAAKPVDGVPNMYHLPLWMMTPGSSSVTVLVRGTQGEGKLLVPVVIEAHQRLVLDRPLGIALGAIGIILFLGMISVVGAAARESVLAPGVVPGQPRKRTARFAMVGAVVAMSALLFGGWTWWNVEDAKFVKTLFQPMTSKSQVRMVGATPYLDIIITDSTWINRNKKRRFSRRGNALLTPLVPDHGKLMHVFVIRESDMNTLAHIHPTTTDSITFSTILPPLPAGQYRVLADVVRESGYAETLTSTMTISADGTMGAGISGGSGQSSTSSDPDDAWFIGPAALTDTTTIAPGLVLHWTRDSTVLTEKIPAPLNFSVRDATGKPVTLEPYMGMSAHAMIMRDDGSVFVHLHPTGTVSMAAQETFAVRQSTDTARGMVARRMQAQTGDPHQGHNMRMQSAGMPISQSASVVGDVTGNVRFPYAFPKSGNYRVWVQVKVAGKILTGSFAAQVKAGQ